MKTLIVYHIDFIDFWGGWTPLRDLLTELIFHHQRRDEPPRWSEDPQEMLLRWKVAQRVSRDLGWEGDIREGPYVCPLPTGKDTHTEYFIAWKQDNNGCTYLASPHVLTWITSDDAAWIMCEYDDTSLKAEPKNLCRLPVDVRLVPLHERRERNRK